MKDDVLIMENVSKSFGKTQVLKKIGLTVRKGENVVVLGRSGMGKSVLIKCIVRLVEPDEGRVEVMGKDMRALDDHSLTQMRRKIGFLFQSSALYDSMSVRENLVFPLRRKAGGLSRGEMDERAVLALRDVGLESAINKMPSQLSGGMRKRVSLARTLILEPQLMLYDEPTTGLDPVTAQEISELIVQVREKHGTSSVIITHDMACAKITGNRALFLDKGTITHEGTYPELAGSPDINLRSFFSAASA